MKIQLRQRGTGWWPDWSHISTTARLLTTKLLLNRVWALAVIVRHMHITVSFGLFCLSASLFPALSLSLSLIIHLSFLSLLWFVFYKGSAHLRLMTTAGWNTTGCLKGRKSFSGFFFFFFNPFFFARMDWKWLCSHSSKSSKSSQRSERSWTRLWQRDQSLYLVGIVSSHLGEKSNSPTIESLWQLQVIIIE